MRSKRLQSHPWYQRWEVYVFLVLATTLYGFLMSLVYKDVMEDDQTGRERIQRSYRISTLYQGSLFILLLVMLYFIVSLLVCAYYYQRDMQTIRAYRSTTKKVKDMSTNQKKRYRDHQHASNRMKWYSCSPVWSAAKIGTLLSSVAAYFLYPHTKKEKSKPLFALLAVLLTPVIFLISASILFLIAGSSRSAY